MPQRASVAERLKPVKEGRTRFSWLRGDYEVVTKKRNQVVIEQCHLGASRRGGYEVVTPSVTAVTLFFR